MIREAEVNDAKKLENLYKELLPNNPMIRVSEDRINEVKENPNSFLFVYELEGDIVGTAHLHLCMDALVESRSFGVVERVIVRREEQGKGYGSELMRFIEGICREKNCIKIFLTSGASRIEAHGFYDKLGYDGESSKAFKKYL
ncbi:GNAT family N-acetyltransferase [Paenibacillus tarimensis]|uniref:GNAT family N-acetyltransferase n=1 Tax=Paenibacillus tarimensis TaxID=416012 RepID=UPI001F2E01B0|nr:GNAT family N-acetyltransferase [Paenibacillus tarimensis]MCF2946005.1 GNAT family N-acetyltransferase [Paenibacillus tarimensis]